MQITDIPYINIFENEFITSEQIRTFLNVSKSIFERMKLIPAKVVGTRNLYDKNNFLAKIAQRIEIYKQCEFVPEFPNYIVNKQGDVFLIKGKIIPYKLKQKIDKYGYKIVALTN